MSFGPNVVGAACAVPAVSAKVRSPNSVLRSPTKDDTFVGRLGVGPDSAQAYPLIVPSMVPAPTRTWPLFRRLLHGIGVTRFQCAGTSRVRVATYAAALCSRACALAPYALIPRAFSR